MKLGFGRNKKRVEAAEVEVLGPPNNSPSPQLYEVEKQPIDYLLENASKTPNAMALVGSVRRLGIGDYLTEVRKTAAELRSLGVKPGQVVATAVLNDDNYVLMGALFHEAAIGCTLPSATEIPGYVDWVITFRDDVIFPQERTIRWDSKMQSRIAENPAEVEPQRYASAESVCRLVFSSGTTGLPKGIPFTVSSIHRRSEMAHTNWMPAMPFMSLIGIQGVSGTQTAYYHFANGLPYLSPSNNFRENLTLLWGNEVAALKASPSQLEGIVLASEESGSKLPKLKYIQSAGSFLPAQLADRLAKHFGSEIVNLFGCSESGTIAVRHGNYLDDQNMGQILPSAEVQVVDENHVPVPTGETGRIRWRTREQASGYYENTAASAKNFIDGWFYSGDEGHLTENKEIYLDGRSSELINLGGMKLNPSKLDGMVKAVSGVKDAACFGFNDGSAVDKIGIAIVIGGDIDRKAIENVFRTEYPNLIPGAVIPVGEIPRAGLDKVKRAELAKMVEDRMKSQRKN